MPRASRLLLPLIVAALCAQGVLTATPSDGASWRTGRSSLPPGHVLGVPEVGTPPLFQASPRGALPSGPGAPESSAWKQAGVYGLEFGGALVGTGVAVVGALGIFSALEAPDPASEWLPIVGPMLALATSSLGSPLLSATGAYFGGKFAGQKGSFWRTLVGSLAGGAVGTAGGYGYARVWSSHHNYWATTQNVILLGCVVIPTALGAVVAYNVW